MQQMTPGALAALRRALGSYSAQGDDSVGQGLQSDATQTPSPQSSMRGLTQLSGMAQRAAAQQPAAPSMALGPEMTAQELPDMRAIRLLREASAVGDMSMDTLKALADQLFAYVPEQVRVALVARAMEMAGGVSSAPMQSAPQMPPKSLQGY